MKKLQHTLADTKSAEVQGPLGCLYLAMRLLRVGEYLKNMFVFLPLFFGGMLTDVHLLQSVTISFVVFCAGASAIYILNDYTDAAQDRCHPVKRFRPIANNEIAPGTALCCAAGLAVVACGLALAQDIILFGIIVLYLVLNVAYSRYLKRMSIIDVTCIAAGFVLRVVAGTVSPGLRFSPWLIMLVFLLCMFMGMGKRWDDLQLENDGKLTGEVRKSLSGYSENFVISSMTFFATISCICYIVYTLAPDTQVHYGSQYVYLTSLWVILGIMRYLQIIFAERRSGSPTRILAKDRFTQSIMVLWIVHVGTLLYSSRV